MADRQVGEPHEVVPDDQAATGQDTAGALVSGSPGPAPRWSREERKRLSRAAIVRSARELFTEQGFDQVTIADVAAHAGVTSRTLFRYFDSKAALVLHDYRELMRQMVQTIARRPVEEAPLPAMCEGIIDFALRRPDSMFIAVGPLWETEDLPLPARNALLYDVVDHTAEMLADRYQLHGPQHRLRVRVWARTGLTAMSSALGEAAARARADDALLPASLGELLREAFAALAGEV